MNAEQIITTVLAAYHSFDTYSDIGTATPDLGKLPDEVSFEFQTFFQRPDKFRFSWTMFDPSQNECRTFQLWTNGAHFKECFFEEVGECQDLPTLVARATGISGGSVHQILNILIPKTLRLAWGWQDMTDSRLLPDENVNGRDCYHLQGTTKTIDDTDLWVDKSTWLIQRIQEKMVITEEDCVEMNAYMLSEESVADMVQALTLRGMSSDEVQRKVDELQEHKMQPHVSYHIYDYKEVRANEPIDSALFEKL